MKTVFTIYALFAFLSIIKAQDTYNIAEGSSITIQGSSTLHDWELTSSSVEGSAVFTLKKKKLVALSSASLSIEVETLKSGKSGLDKNAYKAMNTENFPTITYKMTSAEPESADVGTRFVMDGVVDIAGVKKQISMTVVCNVLDSRIICSGEQGLEMTNYEIDPPSAMFGTIKADNEVTMLCNITFVR